MPTTTTSSIASGGDYSTLQAWWNDRCNGVNFVTDDVIEIGEVSESFTVGAFNTTGTPTTSATQYAHIRPASGQNPTLSTNLGFPTFNISVDHTRLTGNGANHLTIEKTGSTGGVPLRISTSTDGAIVDAVHLVQNDTGGAGTTRVVQVQASVTNLLMSNCIMRFGSSYGGTKEVFFVQSSSSTNLVANCVLDAAGVGTHAIRDGEDTVFQNCYLIDAATAALTGTHSAVTYCATDEASLTGSNHQTSITIGDEFTNRAAFDYSLKTGADGIDNGTSQSDFTTDYDGDTHGSGGTWEIGAYNFAASVKRRVLCCS